MRPHRVGIESPRGIVPPMPYTECARRADYPSEEMLFRKRGQRTCLTNYTTRQEVEETARRLAVVRAGE
jgi:hypothetical protein